MAAPLSSSQRTTSTWPPSEAKIKGVRSLYAKPDLMLSRRGFSPTNLSTSARSPLLAASQMFMALGLHPPPRHETCTCDVAEASTSLYGTRVPVRAHPGM
jgi:hypothetical protein